MGPHRNPVAGLERIPPPTAPGNDVDRPHLQLPLHSLAIPAVAVDQNVDVRISPDKVRYDALEGDDGFHVDAGVAVVCAYRQRGNRHYRDERRPQEVIGSCDHGRFPDFFCHATLPSGRRLRLLK